MINGVTLGGYDVFEGSPYVLRSTGAELSHSQRLFEVLYI